jgi:Golgi SNAP receptor complex protein 2
MLSRDHYALKEHSFIQETDKRLDEFLAHGRDVLGDLVDQRNVLKGTQRRLLDTANTLGMSRDVIGWIEKRRYVFLPFSFCAADDSGILFLFSGSTQDMYIFLGGAVFTFFCFYMIWRYLG